jgi:hypothetical protein
MEKIWVVEGAEADWTLALTCEWRDPRDETDPPRFSRKELAELMNHFCDLVDEHEGVSAARSR